MKMPKRKHNRFTVLAPDLASPRVIAAIDQALEENEQERAELIELRQMAVRRHGGSARVVDNGGSHLNHADGEEQRSANWTIAALIDQYRSRADSPFQKLKKQTKDHYNSCLNRIREDCGNKNPGELDKPQIEILYQEWTKRGEPMARSLFAILRILANYGAENLHSEESDRLALILHRMGLQPAKQRDSEPLTEKDVRAIINKANENGFHSIALAQAIQFECKLGQKEVIGEWVPLTEPGEGKVVVGNRKWIRGILWSNIDSEYILRHIVTRAQEESAIDLKTCPLVMQELLRHPFGPPAEKPLIVSEQTQLPYEGAAFRRYWRKMADEAGIPKHVRNADSRISDDE